MSKNEKIASVLKLMGGSKENAERIVNEVDDFLNSLDAEIEDWKISMEEFSDGTRVFARVQILIKK